MNDVYSYKDRDFECATSRICFFSVFTLLQIETSIINIPSPPPVLSEKPHISIHVSAHHVFATSISSVTPAASSKQATLSVMLLSYKSVRWGLSCKLVRFFVVVTRQDEKYTHVAITKCYGLHASDMKPLSKKSKARKFLHGETWSLETSSRMHKSLSTTPHKIMF